MPIDRPLDPTSLARTPLTRRRHGLLGALVLVLGCKGSGADKKEEPPSPADERKQACDRFATDMARTALMTGQMLVTALDDDPMGASADKGRAEMKGAAQRVKQDLMDKCMAWPDDMMKCLPPLGVLRDGCEERLMAALDGAAPMPTDVPAGPEPSWTFVLESEPRATRIASDEIVVVITGVESDTLVGLRDGKVAWRREGDHQHFIVSVSDSPPTWVVAEREELIAFDPRTGEQRWTASLPPLAHDVDDEFGDGDPPPTIKAAARTANGVLVGDAEARFFHITPKACQSGSADCITPSGTLVDEYLDSDARLLVDSNNRRYLWEEERVRVFDAQLQQLTAFGAHDSLADVSLDDGLTLLVDNDVVQLDVDACASETTIAPSGWPQPNTMVFRDSDTCSDCITPPPGCRAWRHFVADADFAPLTRLANGTALLHTDEHTVAIAGGTQRWKSVTRGVGPMAVEGSRVFGVAFGSTEHAPPVAFELSADDGMTQWHSPLAVDPESSVYAGDIRVTAGHGHLVVSYEQTVHMFDIDGRPQGRAGD